MDEFVYDSPEFKRAVANRPHESGELAFLKSIARPGMVVLEAGANTGVTAVALATAVTDSGHLYALEPVPEYYDQLQANLTRNAVRNATTYNLALSNRAGRIPFYKREGGGSGITPHEDGEMLHVEATTITNLLVVEHVTRVDLLHLDCEGSELLALQGAETILNRDAPKIFCEIHHDSLRALGQSVDDVIGFLAKLGYQIRPLQVDDLNTKPTTDTCSHVYAATAM